MNNQKQSIYRNVPLFCPSDLVDVKTSVSSNNLTWQSEGSETRRYFSRIPSVPPGGNSGITIGRGYDMGSRTSRQVRNDLLAAGFDSITAEILSGGAGLKGSNAKNYIADHDLASTVCITPLQQENLFSITMISYIADTRRLYTKWVHSDHSAIPWDSLDQKVKDLLVDLRYRGDLTHKSFNTIKADLTTTERTELISAMGKSSNWANVPADRLRARVNFLDTIDSTASSLSSSPFTKIYQP